MQALNSMTESEAEKAFFPCCSSNRWAREFAKSRPHKTVQDLYLAADKVWFSLATADWLEAFSHHPQIGANITTLREKFAATEGWAQQEQSGVSLASEVVLKALQQANINYEKKFGHVFLICATGKSAEEMLSALLGQAENDRQSELKNAAVEQSKITKLRLQKLLDSPI